MKEDKKKVDGPEGEGNNKTSEETPRKERKRIIISFEKRNRKIIV